MAQTDYLRIFFQQFHSVVDELTRMFPSERNFSMFKTFLGLLQKTNPTLVISTFHNEVTNKYDDLITERDESFLESYTGAEYGADVADIITTLRPYWSTLSKESKSCLWQYMFVLKELTKRYYAQDR